MMIGFLQVVAGSVLSAAVVLLATYGLIRAGMWLATVLTARLPRYRQALTQMLPVFRIAMWLLAIYVILVEILRPSRESLIAFAAAAGIGIGFAVQDVLRNILGGIVIVTDRPFQVGDRVEIGETRGEVIGIGLRATRILTRDRSLVSVPNSEVVRRSVSNASRGALECQVAIDLVLPWDIDTMEVRQIGREAAATSPYVLPSRPIEVHIRDAAGEAYPTRVRIEAHVYDHRLEDAFISDVTERARRAFREAQVVPHSGALNGDGVVTGGEA